MKRYQLLAGIVAAVFLFAACDDNGTDSDGGDSTTDTLSIVETAESDGRFDTLLAALDAAGLSETLSEDGPYTVFAPTDAAFDALPDGTLDSLLADTDALRNVLLYHVVEDEVPASEVVLLDSVTTLSGETIDIEVDGDSVTVNGANVIITDIQATNGIIHVIDAVLIPPTE